MGIQLFLQAITGRLKKQTKLYRRVMQDKRTPISAKVLLGIAIFYLMLPFDFIPDFIPFFGQLDDAIILPILIGIAFFLVPHQVWVDARQNTNLPLPR